MQAMKSDEERDVRWVRCPISLPQRGSVDSGGVNDVSLVGRGRLGAEMGTRALSSLALTCSHMLGLTKIMCSYLL